MEMEEIPLWHRIRTSCSRKIVSEWHLWRVYARLDVSLYWGTCWWRQYKEWRKGRESNIHGKCYMSISLFYFILYFFPFLRMELHHLNKMKSNKGYYYCKPIKYEIFFTWLFFHWKFDHMILEFRITKNFAFFSFLKIFSLSPRQNRIFICLKYGVGDHWTIQGPYS